MQAKILSFCRQIGIPVTISMEYPFSEGCLEEYEHSEVLVKMNCIGLLKPRKECSCEMFIGAGILLIAAICFWSGHRLF